MPTNAEILDTQFKRRGEGALDAKNRVPLTKALEALKASLGDLTGVRFEISCNSVGQVLLSPTVAIPAHESWLYKNPEALASVRRGLTQAARGKQKAMGSFAKYANDDIE